jgi:HK97 family phage major capsid protein
MRSIKKLQDRAAAIVHEQQAMSAVLEEDDRLTFNESEQATFDALNTEAGDVQSAIEREEGLRDRERKLARPIRTAIDEPDGEDTPKKDEKPKFQSDGEYFQAVIRASMPNGYVDPRLSQVGAATGMSEGLSSDGGFLVEKQTEAGLLKRVHETGQVWNRCRNVTIGPGKNGTKINAINETSRTAGNRLGGIRGYWLEEGGTKTKSKPTLRQISLQLRKLIGLAYATDELLEDAEALESVLMQGFAEEFGFKLDDAVINGSGAGMPKGILQGTAGAASARVRVTKETGQAATTLVAENVEKMYARMWTKSIQNAVWFINQDAWPQIFQLSHSVGTGGVPMFIPGGGLNQSPNGTLLGRPIVPIEQCQTLGTEGDIIFADCSQYVTCTKGGIQSASSIHVQFTTDETTLRWVYRADGQPVETAPLTPANGSNTVSSFITLQTRS